MILTDILKVNLEAEAQWLRQYLDELRAPVVFSHGNLRVEQIIIRKYGLPQNRLAFLNLGWGRYLYRGYDLADFFLENAIQIDRRLPYPHFKVDTNFVPNPTELNQLIGLYLNSMTAQEREWPSAVNTVEGILEEMERNTLLSHFYKAVQSLFRSFYDFGKAFGHPEYSHKRLEMYFLFKKQIIEQKRLNIPLFAQSIHPYEPIDKGYPGARVVGPNELLYLNPFYVSSASISGYLYPTDYVSNQLDLELCQKLIPSAGLAVPSHDYPRTEAITHRVPPFVGPVNVSPVKPLQPAVLPANLIPINLISQLKHVPTPVQLPIRSPVLPVQPSPPSPVNLVPVQNPFVPVQPPVQPVQQIPVNFNPVPSTIVPVQVPVQPAPIVPVNVVNQGQFNPRVQNIAQQIVDQEQLARIKQAEFVELARQQDQLNEVATRLFAEQENRRRFEHTLNGQISKLDQIAQANQVNQAQIDAAQQQSIARLQGRGARGLYDDVNQQVRNMLIVDNQAQSARNQANTLSGSFTARNQFNQGQNIAGSAGYAQEWFNQARNLAAEEAARSDQLVRFTQINNAQAAQQAQLNAAVAQEANRVAQVNQAQNIAAANQFNRAAQQAQINSVGTIANAQLNQAQVSASQQQINQGQQIAAGTITVTNQEQIRQAQLAAEAQQRAQTAQIAQARQAELAQIEANRQAQLAAEANRIAQINQAQQAELIRQETLRRQNLATLSQVGQGSGTVITNQAQNTGQNVVAVNNQMNQNVVQQTVQQANQLAQAQARQAELAQLEANRQSQLSQEELNRQESIRRQNSVVVNQAQINANSQQQVQNNLAQARQTELAAIEANRIAQVQQAQQAELIRQQNARQAEQAAIEANRIAQIKQAEQVELIRQQNAARAIQAQNTQLNQAHITTAQVQNVAASVNNVQNNQGQIFSGGANIAEANRVAQQTQQTELIKQQNAILTQNINQAQNVQANSINAGVAVNNQAQINGVKQISGVSTNSVLNQSQTVAGTVAVNNQINAQQTAQANNLVQLEDNRAAQLRTQQGQVVIQQNQLQNNVAQAQLAGVAVNHAQNVQRLANQVNQAQNNAGAVTVGANIVANQAQQTNQVNQLAQIEANRVAQLKVQQDQIIIQQNAARLAQGAQSSQAINQAQNDGIHGQSAVIGVNNQALNQGQNVAAVGVNNQAQQQTVQINQQNAAKLAQGAVGTQAINQAQNAGVQGQSTNVGVNNQAQIKVAGLGTNQALNQGQIAAVGVNGQAVGVGQGLAVQQTQQQNNANPSLGAQQQQQVVPQNVLAGQNLARPVVSLPVGSLSQRGVGPVHHTNDQIFIDPDHDATYFKVPVPKVVKLADKPAHDVD